MSSDCSEMMVLSQSTYLNISLLVNLIVAIIASFMLIWAMHKLWVMKYSTLFHFNLKIIIQMHLAGFLIHCCSRIILHSLDLYNYHMREPCDMIPNIYRCFILRLFYNCGFMLTNTTSLIVVIERYIATEKSHKYEFSSARIGICLALLQVFIIATPLIFIYSNSYYFDNKTMYYCVTAEASSPLAAQVSAGVSICIQIVAIVSFMYLDKRNKKIRRNESESTLSHKYQLEQNLSSIYIFKVFAYLSAFYLIVQNAGHIVLMCIAVDLLPEHFYASLEIVISYPFYSIVTVIVMTITVHHNRRRIENLLTIHVETDQSHYFEYFKKQIA